jgi:hypothetical protein
LHVRTCGVSAEQAEGSEAGLTKKSQGGIRT